MKTTTFGGRCFFLVALVSSGDLPTVAVSCSSETAVTSAVTTLPSYSLAGVNPNSTRSKQQMVKLLAVVAEQKIDIVSIFQREGTSLVKSSEFYHVETLFFLLCFCSFEKLREREEAINRLMKVVPPNARTVWIPHGFFNQFFEIASLFLLRLVFKKSL